MCIRDRFLECYQQRVRVAFLLLHLLLDRGRCLLIDRSWRCARLHIADEALEVGSSVLQRVNEEADQRQPLGDTLEVALVGGIPRL